MGGISHSLISWDPCGCSWEDSTLYLGDSGDPLSLKPGYPGRRSLTWIPSELPSITPHAATPMTTPSSFLCPDSFLPDPTLSPPRPPPPAVTPMMTPWSRLTLSCWTASKPPLPEVLVAGQRGRRATATQRGSARGRQRRRRRGQRHLLPRRPPSHSFQRWRVYLKR